MLRGTRESRVNEAKMGDTLSKKSAAISLIRGVSSELEGKNGLPPTIPAQSLVVCVPGSQV